MKSIQTSLIIFLKYPDEGKVKTRLATVIGDYYAKEIYKLISSNIIEEIKKIENVKIYIFYSGENNSERFENWLGKEFNYLSQNGNDLGERMKNAFENVFSFGANKAIIMGTDIPGLNSKNISEAIRKLDKKDIVIGPSKDGGYYLLGMRNFYREIFEGIEYSNNMVYQRTLQKINKLKLEYESLIILQDIDTESDLNEWLQNEEESKIKREMELYYKSIIN